MQYLDEDYRVTVLHDGKEYALTLAISIILDTKKNFVEEKKEGIEIAMLEKGEETSVAKVQTFEEIKAFFGQDTNEDFLFVDTVAGYRSLEEYQKAMEFRNASMEYLLEKYSDCDTFALCGFFHGKLSKTASKKILAAAEERGEEYLRRVYEKVRGEYALEPFETLYQNIRRECEAFEKTHKKKYMRKYGFFSNSFICDHVGEDTRYDEPRALFWHAYHQMGTYIDYRQELEDLVRNGKKTHPSGVLNRKAYEGLKPDYIGYEITYATHCTSGPLQRQLYFRLTDNAKAWLRTHKDDYDFEVPLQDLAFFKNGKLRFSSCTHEGFHDDIPET